MTDTQTDAAAIIATARLSTSPHDVEPGGLYVVPAAGGYQTIDLTGDKYRDFPKRKSGIVTVRDVASFAHYFKKHADAASEVFADLDGATVTAVLDAHNPNDGDPDNEARWQQHRLVLAMAKTPVWAAWTGKDRSLMSQQDFAEFIEEHATDVAADGPISAADLLELAQDFHVHTKVTFGSGTRLASGQTQFTYVEEATASAGKRGTITVPPEFELGLRPIEDCAPFRVKARFRHRSNEAGLRLGYVLDDPARIFREAVQDVTEQAAEACGVVIMRGKPS